MTHTAKHTPGPWTVQDSTDNDDDTTLTIYASKDEASIAIMDAFENGCECFSEIRANATLIAAAPAMYEALAKLRLEAIHYRNTGVGVQFLNEAIAQAEQAINQVWGEGDHDTKREG